VTDQPNPNPTHIWLDPICNDAEREGRCWQIFAEDCPDCEEKAVKYIRADLVGGDGGGAQECCCAPIDYENLDEGGNVISPAGCAALASLPSSEPVREAWQPIETVPKDRLIDIWTDGWGAEPHRVADCYYDQICGEWRTSRPSGQLLCVKERHVTHWMDCPSSPVSRPDRGGGDD
jgi:hypothetical protein